ncbi:hypothetical protein ALC56_07601 [Trachymyrmex septentrionalis]|uniref:Uncharacterized protein n=1 Tax=Trachymyrmex septentrionalis TaxID=34720 RepID=A0A195FCP9_9HYME|nr:hypothetical protein ALC56_07601 [Trachymyrmex septentrionalis]
MLLTSWYTLPLKDFRDRIDVISMERGKFATTSLLSSSRRKYDEDDKLNPGAVVPRRRLKQFAINFPRAEGNGAGQGTERGVAEQEGYRKDLEQGFWKESIRVPMFDAKHGDRRGIFARIVRECRERILAAIVFPENSLFSFSDTVNGGKPAASRIRTIGLCATLTIYYKTVPLCSRYVHCALTRISTPPFSSSSGNAHRECTTARHEISLRLAAAIHKAVLNTSLFHPGASLATPLITLGARKKPSPQLAVNRRDLPNRSRLFADKNLVIKIFDLNANGYFPLSRAEFFPSFSEYLQRKRTGSVSRQSITECTRNWFRKTRVYSRSPSLLFSVHIKYFFV